MLGDVARLVGKIQRVVPLVQRIVDSHPESLRAHGGGQVAEQVAPGADLDGVPRASPGPGGLLARPQGKAFVMLRGERDIFRARPCEDVRPVIGVEQFGAELRREVPVIVVRAVHALVVVP